MVVTLSTTSSHASRSASVKGASSRAMTTNAGSCSRTRSYKAARRLASPMSFSSRWFTGSPTSSPWRTNSS
eukprot:9802862-Lingulodinium_polyedra.AAC.1